MIPRNGRVGQPVRMSTSDAIGRGGEGLVVVVAGGAVVVVVVVCDCVIR